MRACVCVCVTCKLILRRGHTDWLCKKRDNKPAIVHTAIHLAYSIHHSGNGNWAQWSDWSNCIAPCGTQSRSRTCTDPEPHNGGRNCDGQHYESRNCGTELECRGNFLSMFTFLFLAACLHDLSLHNGFPLRLKPIK